MSSHCVHNHNRPISNNVRNTQHTTDTPTLSRVTDCPTVPRPRPTDPRQGPTEGDPEKKNHGCAHGNPFSLSEVRGAPPWGVGPAPLHMYRYQYPVRDVFWNGGGGEKVFSCFFFGLYTLGEEIGYSKGRGWGMGEMLQGISPIPPF